MSNLSPSDLSKVKRMCDIILNSPPLHPELDSLAFDLGHHPDLLGVPSPPPFAPRTGVYGAGPYFDDPLA